jgi:transglutaminase-like putative cysteine protease
MKKEFNKLNMVFAFALVVALVIASVVTYVVIKGWAGDVSTPDYSQYGVTPSKKEYVEATTRQVLGPDGNYYTSYVMAQEKELYTSVSVNGGKLYYIKEDMTSDKVYFDVDSTQSRYIYDINSIPVSRFHFDKSFDYTKYKVGDVLYRINNDYGGTTTAIISSSYVANYQDSKKNYVIFYTIDMLKYDQVVVDYYNSLENYDRSIMSNMPTCYEYSVDATTRKEIKAQTEKVIAGCTTNYEKAWAIYEWLYTNVKYVPKEDSNDPQRAWEKKAGVCGAFAQLYQIMCVYAEVPCLYLQSISAEHAWNAVYVDGQWIGVDASTASKMAHTSAHADQNIYSCFDLDMYQSDVTDNYDEFPKSNKKWKKGDTIQDGKMTYTVTNVKKATVSLTSVKSAGKTVTIPGSVTQNNKTFQVTAVTGNICTSKTTKVVIGANVKKLGSGVFGGKNVKTIVIKSSKLKASNISADVFKGCSKKGKTVTITVPKSKYKAYKAWITKYKGKSKAKIKITKK